MLTVFQFNDQGIRFENREGRVWVSLTDMARVTGKQVGHWKQLDSTKEFIDKLEVIIGIPIITSKIGGQYIPEIERGTWGIQQLAINFASWCSVDFHIWVTEQITTLMTQGYVELKPKPYPVESLPPGDVRVANLIDALKFMGIDHTNPRYHQALQDLTLNILGVNSLPSADKEVWMGVAERAEELGYPIMLVTKHRSMLGKWVKSHNHDYREEKRLCNGTQRSINVYRVCDELDATIREFMNVKMEAGV
jgi:hypothetical protein